MRALLVCFLLLCPLAARAHDVPWVHYAVLGDDVVVEASGEDVDETTPFAIASVSKAMIAVALLRYVERDALSLEDLAIDLRPDLPALNGIDRVTLRQLLTMTSGLAEYYWDDYIDDARADPEEVLQPLAALTYALGEPAGFAPGEIFDYSNTNYVIAGLILEAVSGQSLAEALRKEVFDPAGMHDSFVAGSRPLPADFPRGHEGWRHIRDYYAWPGFGDGGVLASARDVAAFYIKLFMTNDLLSPDLRAEMLKDPLGQGYGMGVALGGDIVGHAGADLGFVSDVVLNRRTGDVAVVLVANARGDTSWAFNVLSLR